MIDGLADSENPEKYRSYQFQQEIDISRVPNSLLDGLIPVGVEDAIVRAEELYPENASEIWILQCPTNIKLSSLIQGKKIFLDDREQLFSSEENDSKSFETVCIPGNSSISNSSAVVLPDESGKIQIVSFPVAGHIMIKQIIEEVVETVVLPSPTTLHRLPSGIKVRHPIYGTDYEKIIQDTSSTFSMENVRKRKALEVETELEMEGPPRKKKRKCQKMVETESSQETYQSAEAETLQVPPLVSKLLKKKKSKTIENSEYVNINNEAHEQHLEKTHKGSKRIKIEAPEEEYMKKKRKKSKEIVEVKEEVEEEPIQKKKKKKKKKKSKEIIDIKEECEESPKKKKKHKEVEVEEQITISVKKKKNNRVAEATEVIQELVISKKKKKFM